MKIVTTGDFVELQFTGKTNGVIFDSNIAEDLKTIAPDAKPHKVIVAAGHNMLPPGFDKALLDKEVGKQYTIHLKPSEGFGVRHKDLVKIIPVKVFHAQKLDPKPGATFFIDGRTVKVIAVSGARATVDFNNPLAGKELEYSFTIVRIIENEAERVDAFVEYFLRVKLKHRIEGDKVVLIGPKILEQFCAAFNAQAKEILKKELVFEEEKEVKKAPSKEQNQEEAQQQSL